MTLMKMVNIVNQIIETTVGRVIFNQYVPKKLDISMRFLPRNHYVILLVIVLKMTGTAKTARIP